MEAEPNIISSDFLKKSEENAVVLLNGNYGSCRRESGKNNQKDRVLKEGKGVSRRGA